MLSKNLELSLHRALSIAREYNHEYATLEHLLLSLSEDSDAKIALHSCNVNVKKLGEKLKNFLRNELSALVLKDVRESKPTAGFQRVVHRAAIHVHALGKKEINGANVLAEIFSEQESYAVLFLTEQNITRHDIMNTISKSGISAEKPAKLEEDKIPSSFKSAALSETDFGDADQSSFLDKDDKSESSPLAKYCVNLTKLAKEHKIDVLIGREPEIERAIEVLCRRNKNNPLFVGEPGVGKTAIAEGLALRLSQNDVPSSLKGTVIFSLDMGSLVAGTRYRGDFEERIKMVIKEIQKLPSAILFIDEIHTIIGAGSTNGSALDAGNLLKPALARALFRCIGSTTFKEYQNHFEKDQALARRFQKIVIDEPSKDNAYLMLEGLRPYYEKHHGVKYTDEALVAAVSLSQRYINDRKLPDKAIDVIDEAGAHINLLPETKKKKTVTVKDIEETVAKIVHIPAKTLSRGDNDKILTLAKNLQSRVFGQDKAIEELVLAIKLSQAGLRRYEKPIGSYLFAGPTGVGKTELAKQLANEISMKLLRFDMSEYMEQHSVSRLIGSPPGYVGFDQGGLLTDEVRKSPYSVILLDEIEKAHPDIYNLMLQVMDYGTATDHNGRSVNFSNCVIIMTTNAGAFERSKAGLGFGRDESLESGDEPIKKLFTPEFRNRLDAIIYFEKLDQDIVALIVDKFIDQLKSQLADRNTRIDVSKEARNYLCTRGNNKDNGAREIERILNEKVGKSLADEILFGKLKKGGKVKVDLKNDELTFKFSG